MKRITSGIILGLLFSSGAYAQMVNVPCQEFVEVTGKKMACDKIPVLKMSKDKWEAEKAAAEEQNADDAETPPWKREAKPGKVAKEPEVIADCDLPPWKRPKGLKCND